MPKPPTQLPEAKVDPSPELERRTRRRFSLEYKLKVMAQADACRHGELLRREKLYSSQLAQWRRELAEGGVGRLGKSVPGPVSARTPVQRENERLVRENARLLRQLEIANDCLALQKKSLVDAGSREQRERWVSVVMNERPARLPLRTAGAALGLNRSTVYARRRRCQHTTAVRTTRRNGVQPRALSDAERERVLATLMSEAYRDQPPYEVYHQLLEQGEYRCSTSTMYRLLRERRASGKRRAQRPAQHQSVPRLRAEAPNEVWTWDITKLPTVRRGVYLSLYVVLDLFSRLALAWMVSTKENSTLSCQLMREASERYGVSPGQLTIHQDQGAPMIAHTDLDLMSELGITASHSRPRVSNDHPFSESAFKTQKYQPDYPGRFADLVHATRWCGDYFPWYNGKHHHAGLGGFTPEQVYAGRFRAIAMRKQRALDAQYACHPERFTRGRPLVPMPPVSVSINPVTETDGVQGSAGTVNYPTLMPTGAKSKCTLSENPLSKIG